MYSTTVSISEAKEIYKNLSQIVDKVLKLDVCVYDSNASTFNHDTTIEMIERRGKREETWYRRLGEYTGDLMADIVVRPVNAIRIFHIFVVFSDRPALSLNVVPDPAIAWPRDKEVDKLLDPNYVAKESD